jgi:SAM-dependent methyltransferase
LSSLVAQSRTPTQVVVVNDGTEPVAEVTQSFVDRLPDLTVVATPHPYSGPSEARNVGLATVTQSVIAYLDDDNEMASRWLAAVTDHFEANPDSTFVYGGQLRLDAAAPDGVLFRLGTIADLRETNWIDTGMIAHRSSDVRWNTALRRLTDWDFALTIADSEGVDPLRHLASIYDGDSRTRISTGTSYQVFRDSVIRRHSSPRGEAHCTLCGYVGNFGPGPSGQPEASCPNCRALPRHRLLSLLLPWIAAHLSHSGRSEALEIAPFESSERLFSDNGLRLLTMDVDPTADGRQVDLAGDLQALPCRDESVPLLLASHVLEHVRDDHLALSEIARVLTVGGLAVIQVPLRADGRPTEEDVDAPEAERVRRFGQQDHLRLYGDDITDRIETVGLAVHRADADTFAPRHLAAEYRLNLDEPYFLAHPRGDCDQGCWVRAMLAEASAVSRGLEVYLAQGARCAR